MSGNETKCVDAKKSDLALLEEDVGILLKEARVLLVKTQDTVEMLKVGSKDKISDGKDEERPMSDTRLGELRLQVADAITILVNTASTIMDVQDQVRE